MSGEPKEEVDAEMEALDALGALADFATYVCSFLLFTHTSLIRSFFLFSPPSYTSLYYLLHVFICSGEALDDDDEAMEDASPAAAAAANHIHQPAPDLVPAVDRLGREMQKWIQCTSCLKWRRVPYTLDDSQISEDWTCVNNIWDTAHASCDISQELSDDAIDAILQYQADQLVAAERAAMEAAAEAAAAAHAAEAPMHELAAAYDDPSAYDDDDYEEGSRKNKRTNGRWGRGRGRGRGRGSGPGKGGRGRRSTEYDVTYRALPGRPRTGTRLLGRGDQDEAAEALLGMGFAYDDEGEEPTAPRERYPPGKVVWAKVEGHDWWPGKVVRRRAVPREVGLPPGGPESVRFQTPVVFFTAKGIPGEAPAGMNSIQAALNALKPLESGGVPTLDDEAEYAWLPAEALKAFMLGDTSGDGEPPDETLRTCIAAANRAVSALVTTATAAAAAAAASGAADGGGGNEQGDDTADGDVGQEAAAAAAAAVVAAAAAEVESDSDGGWGPQTAPMMNSNSYRGGRRGGRGGRRGKGRGGRRGRGRGRWGRYEEDDGSDEDYEPGGGGLIGGNEMGGGGGQQRIIVEGILGWRWPGKEEENAAAAAPAAVAVEVQQEDATAAAGGAVKSEDEDGVEADMEADAVAALLAAADGEHIGGDGFMNQESTEK